MFISISIPALVVCIQLTFAAARMISSVYIPNITSASPTTAAGFIHRCHHHFRPGRGLAHLLTQRFVHRADTEQSSWLNLPSPKWHTACRTATSVQTKGVP